jgi:hypothetical protein
MDATEVERLHAAAVAIGRQEISFLAVLVAASTATAAARAYRDADYGSWGQLLALGFVAGSVSVACVCLVGYGVGGIVGHELLLVFVALIAGVIGKPLEQNARKKLERILGLSDAEH